MSIVSSELTEETAQADGRFWVEERHTDHVAVVHVIRYLAGVGLDVEAVLAARAGTLEIELAQTEINEILQIIFRDGSESVFIPVHATEQNAKETVRSAYINATGIDAIMIGDFMSMQSDATLQGLFDIDQTETDTLRADYLTPQAAEAAFIRAAVGT